MRKFIRILKISTLVIINLFVIYTFIGLNGYVFGWFAPAINQDSNIDGKTTDPYFHRGDGSYTDPFTITRPVHLYNLAKLQEAGAFGNHSYYFQLGIEVLNNQIVADPIYTMDENGVVRPGENYSYYVYGNNEDFPSSTVLDMTDFIKNGEDFIIPIGGSLITKGVDGLDLLPENYYPSEFLGYFEGNRITIKNLKIQANEDFCHVGLFGIIGAPSLVQNFILDSPTITTTSTTPLQMTTEHLATTDPDFHNFIGFLSGYTAGGMFNIGVYKGDMVLSSVLYHSRFSWVGSAAAELSNNGDVSGNILDTIIEWGSLVTIMGVVGQTWNNWKSSTDKILSTDYSTTLSNCFTDSNLTNDPYNKDVFEIVAPIVMQKINSAGFTSNGSYNFPMMSYDLSGAKTNEIVLASAPPKYDETITTNHVYPNGNSLSTVFQATGDSNTLASGKGGVRFTVDYAGDLLLTYSSPKASTLGIYKMNTNGTTYSPYPNADWTFGTGKVANPVLSNVRFVDNSATATAQPYSPTTNNGSVVTCVVRVKEAGTYIIGTYSGEPIAFGYTRFIIDSSQGNTSGTSDSGSVDSIYSVDFTYLLNNELVFPSSTTFALSRVNVYFPNTSTGVTVPITLYYRREAINSIAVFNLYAPRFNLVYYTSKYGNGTLNMLNDPPT
ncbi:hypothetical protein LJC17_01615 [Acholeplasma sp. OttesenSCG-928-E16]|nr:hypothetical protein [Acholeplasma sp. OttesenSCG-928-E16]